VARIMSDLESLCDLVEMRAAQYQKPKRKLWVLVFTAIGDGRLIVNSPDDTAPLQLDWKSWVPDAIRGIERRGFDPAKHWPGRLMVSPSAFDSCLFPAPPKRKSGRKSKLSEFQARYRGCEMPPHGAIAKEFGVDVRTVGRWIKKLKGQN